VSLSTEIVLGIDLGTTYSTAAALIDGRLHYALDGRGESCVPSVVHFPRSGPPLVGAEAERQRSSDPQNTVYGIKRLIGRSADSPQARVLDASSAFKIRAQPGEAAVQVRNGTFAASEVGAMILRYLRERAEARFQRRCTKAVLTVPVLATEDVKAAMIRCGKMAGLEVLRIVHEPVAGAVARGFGGPDWGSEPVLVYDFGGGTFDAAVVQKEAGPLRVLSAGGDDCLGGDDFDLSFARWLAEVVWKLHGVEISKDAILWDRAQRQCESVKRQLSTTHEARLLLRDAFGSGARTQHLEYLIRRDSLAPRWQDLVDRSIDASIGTVHDSGMERRELGAVLLIGGTSYVPQVRAAVAQAFEQQLAVEADPQTAVARGAALLAAEPGQLAS
jgi:molecular chaperone DnaK